MIACPIYTFEEIWEMIGMPREDWVKLICVKAEEK